jgi:hypothetical protein
MKNLKSFKYSLALMVPFSLAAGSAGAASYEQACLDIDDTSAQVTSGELAYTDSIFFCVNGALTQEGDTGDAGENAVLASGEITQVDPLINPDLWAATALEAGLPEATAVTFEDARAFSPHPDTAFDDAFFEATGYIGAVDPNTDDPWWRDWTLISDAGSLSPPNLPPDALFHPLEVEIVNGTISPAQAASCPVGTAALEQATLFGVNFPICVISAPITTDVTLTNGHVYLLKGTIDVGNGGAQGATPQTVTPVVLTIEPGTQIFGDTTADTSAIVITRGSKIMAVGTREMPIVMSSADNGNPSTSAGNNFFGYNEWGGVIIDGFAPVNAGAEVVSEAAPDGVTRYFGGADPTDSSGRIEYVVVTESGQEFRPNEEIQGITLEGAGSGTLLDFVQVHHSGDDGIEFLGGLANLRHAVITGVDDDSLDMDLGYQGGVQFLIARQTADRGNNTIESDNNGDNFDAQPRTLPTIANITLLGNTGRPEDTTVGALHREGFGGFLHKVIIADDLNAP